MKKIALPAVVAGALLMGANSLVAAMDGVIVRFVAGEVHPIGIVFFRNLASLIALYLLLFRRGFPLGIAQSSGRAMHFSVHAIRAVIKLLALVAAFIAVTEIPLASATAIAFTMPLFVALGSVLFLGERFSAARVFGLVAGFAGILIVVRPGAATFQSGAAWALASAVGLAIVALLMKVSAEREDPLSIAWLNLLVTVPVAFVMALPFWQTPSLFSLALMTLQGIGGLFAQLSFARAMKLADASLLVIVDFIRLPIALILGLVLFGEPIRLEVVIGGAIILGAIALLFHREGRRRG
ncbi:EamA family transporter [Sinorhizobium meliloti]|nr:EamA family transporter [Sinorhizobium meliloti]